LRSQSPSRTGRLDVLLKCLVCAVIFIVAASGINAQSSQVEARVTEVSGVAICANVASQPRPVQRGEQVSPGDEIDTRGGGRVVIDMVDGSVIIVQPGSRILFQDSTSAGSLFESFAVLLGRVQFKIYHFAGRPNPYRVNSPTASIAARGTEFDVSVQESGSTEVNVSVGEVEVSSLDNPGRRVMVGPGSSVIVRPNATILFLGPGSTQYDQVRDGRKDDSSDAAAIYERYNDSLIEPAETAAPALFLAFSDPNLDSIENPAYATEFSSAEGQVLLLPSLSSAQTAGSSAGIPGSMPDMPPNYAVSPQGTFFVPLHGIDSVVGGSFAVSHGTMQSLSIDSPNAQSRFPLGVTSVSGSMQSTFANASLMYAHTVGRSGATSFGLAFSQTWNSGDLTNATARTAGTGLVPRQSLASKSTIRRSELVAGLTHVFSGAHKLGVEYRYGVVSSGESDNLTFVQTSPDGSNATDSARGTSSELRVLMRGPISRRLFYGVQGELLFASEDESTQEQGGENEGGPEHNLRGVLSAGLGYAPRKRILLAFDLAGGSIWTTESQTASETKVVVESSRNQMLFYSAHAAIQADIWRRLFASASLLSLTQTTQNHMITVFIDPSLDGVSQNVFNRVLGDHFVTNSSDFGIGWRFNHNFLAEYIYSTDYGLTSPRHTILLRHNFRIGHE
jgi:hypothetical protein